MTFSWREGLWERRHALDSECAVGGHGRGAERTAQAQDDGPQLGWADTAELTVVLTGGNAEASTLGFKNELVRVWDQATLSIAAGALRAESSTITRVARGVPSSFAVSKDSVSALTAESYYARGQYDRELNDRTYWYGGGGVGAQHLRRDSESHGVGRRAREHMAGHRADDVQDRVWSDVHSPGQRGGRG